MGSGDGGEGGLSTERTFESKSGRCLSTQLDMMNKTRSGLKWGWRVVVFGWLSSSAFAADFVTQRWRVAEIPLTSAVNYADPFQDVEVTATFTGPGGEVIVRPGFWDGGSTWRFRFAPTVAGAWSMVTTCTNPADKGLQGVTRTLQCDDYTGPYAIYQRGFLKVSADGRYFVYADGTPFFYLGDTHWLFPHERFETSNVPGVPSQFKYTVDKRVAQGFTVFQTESIHNPHGGTHTNADEEAHCDLRDGLTAADLPGFANMDRKFAYLADHGLVHAHAGLTWALEPVKNPQYYTPAYMAKLGRYWAARFGAYPVLWTIAQEIDPNMYKAYDMGTIGLWYAGAQAIADNDAYDQPLGVHLQAIGNGIEGPDESWWANKPYHQWWPVQLQGDLSGFSAAKRFWQYAPAKPTVLYEAPYEDFWTDAKGARGAGYKAFQWGMYGYGYGANGTWNDLYSPDDFGTDYEMPNRYLSWYDGANLPGAVQLGYLKKFYTALQWWKLVPRFDDPAWSAFTDPNHSLLSSDGNATYVVYFFGENDETGTLKGMAPEVSYAAAWFNPRAGTFIELGTVSADNGEWTIPVRPTPDDWVLLVNRSK